METMACFQHAALNRSPRFLEVTELKSSVVESSDSRMVAKQEVGRVADQDAE
jgi:hypothetical protein